MSKRKTGWTWVGQRRPQLELLETRWNPSTVKLHGDNLIILGTPAADTVAITDNGQGELTVTYNNTASGRGGQNGGSNGSGGSGSNRSNGSNGSDSNGSNGGGGGGLPPGPTTATFSGVEDVIFLGFDGNDQFTYNLSAALTDERGIRAFLGDGDDTATFGLQ